MRTGTFVSAFVSALMSARDEPQTWSFVPRVDWMDGRFGQVRGTPTVSLVAYWEVDREALEASINSTETLAASDEEALGNGDACVPNEGIGGEEHVSAEKAFFRIVAR